MRHFIAGVSLIALLADGHPAGAASDITAFTVSATVVASCTITPDRLISRPASAACTPATPPSTIQAPRPTVVVTHDGASGLDRLTIEF